MNKETRTLTMPIELRASENDENKQVIVGYALKFNSKSENLGGFVEVIDPSALNGADMSDVRGLFNHDPNMVLARSKSGTLTLEVDEFGLKYIIDPPDTSFARDLAFSMGRGDIDQSSFGFSITGDGDEWEYDEQNDIYLRTIKRFDKIFDVSVVTYPAYQASESTIAQRSLEDHKKAQEDLRKAQAQKEARALRQKQIEIELELF
ncbi:HK97 family phage prohead protease [Halobacillus sp. Marseille-P3879]|uniref:HK97 family phage prohead protease n=1 Tax=Halobacillus sp. Marseille-P3879 TaxID=2045014 RepID=UPI000C7C9810|nr:HK97 family phage prohead protease [Halobacillus sp. Marseille-P3879]